MNYNVKKKVPFTVIAIILLSALAITYLYLFFSPGLWYGDVFLYKKSAGSYSGWEISGEYVLTTTTTDQGMDFSFAADGKTAQYRLVYSPEEHSHRDAVYIYKNGTLIFEGHPEFDGKYYWASDKNNQLVDVSTSGLVLQGADGFPTCSQLLNWYFKEDMPIRGNLAFFYVFIAAVTLLCLSYLPKLILRQETVNKGIFTMKTIRMFLVTSIPVWMLLSFIVR